MTRQKKCPSCSHWNPGELVSCEKCNSLLDKNEVLKEEREKKYGRPKIEKPGWLDAFMERTKNTGNPFVKLVRFCLTVGWITYMAILTFIIWFAVGFSG